MVEFIPSLVSVTFQSLPVEQVAELAGRAGLQAIEWSGRPHSLPGDMQAAERCRQASLQRGIAICAYGSYYRLGISKALGLTFQSVLETALHLGTPRVRVWAGERGSRQVTVVERQQIVEDARRCAELAAACGLVVFSEWHGNTLTDELASGVSFLEKVGHPAFRTAWQPPLGLDDDACCEQLRQVIPYLEHLHVYHWKDVQNRRPLVEGANRWTRFLAEAARAGRPLHAALEFVRDDSPGHLLEDTAVLKDLCDGRYAGECHSPLLL
jgi:sugar phosphate isomerase/epimerase